MNQRRSARGPGDDARPGAPVPDPPPSSVRRWLPIQIAAAITITVVLLRGWTFDTIDMAGPDDAVVTSAVGQTRVLRLPDDPTLGDAWVDVLHPSEAVVVETGSFREADSRHAEPDEPAEERRLLRSVGAGRTLLVMLNCLGCRDGRPTTDLTAAQLQVWDLTVDGSAVVSLGEGAATRDRSTTTAVGQYVVVAAPTGRGPAELTAIDATVLLPIVSHTPEDGAAWYVDVFLATAAGSTTIGYTTDNGDEIRYPVTVRGAAPRP